VTLRKLASPDRLFWDRCRVAAFSFSFALLPYGSNQLRRSASVRKGYRDPPKLQRNPRLNLTDQGYRADRLAAEAASGQNSTQALRPPGPILIIIEFAPLVFGTAALLAVFLFFAVPEH
jgi:hypothetical protein